MNLKNNWKFLLILVLLVVGILIMIFQKHDDPGAVIKFQIGELKKELKETILVEFDSIQKVISVPIPTDFSHADSLQQETIDLNNKIVYELRKKNERRIDTVPASDLKSIFEEYGRQHPISGNPN